MKHRAGTPKGLSSILAALAILTGFFLAADLVGAGQNRADEIQSIFDRGWYLLNHAHLNPKGLEEALGLYAKVLEIEPENPDVHWKMAEIKFFMGEMASDSDRRVEIYQDSLADAKEAMARKPESLEAYFWLGCNYGRLAELSNIFKGIGLVKKARQALEKSIAIDPVHPYTVVARATLAAIYTEAPWPIGDRTKAEALAKEAVGMDPNLTFASERLAKVYFHNQEYDKALKEIERCLAIREPTYRCDAVLFDWPAVRKLKLEIERTGTSTGNGEN